LKDPRIWDLLGKIKVVADPEIDAMFPGVKRARVAITTTSGDTHQAQVDHAKGSPQNPMSDEEIVAKFLANSERVIDSKRQQEAIDQTWAFDEVDNIEEYMRLFIQNK
jgi:2-methylcitrate dehydratase